MKLLQVTVRALKLDKEETSNATANSSPAATQATSSQDLNVIAAIAAAVHDKELNS